MDEDMALRVRVSGRVQGVWFRAWTRARAEELGLRGWVRNEADGSVSALIAGPGAAVAEMLRDLHKGPDAALVASVETTAAEAPMEVGFVIRR